MTAMRMMGMDGRSRCSKQKDEETNVRIRDERRRETEPKKQQHAMLLLDERESECRSMRCSLASTAGATVGEESS